MKRFASVASVAMVLVAGLTACAPSAEEQDKKACQDWSASLVDFAQSGGGELAAKATAGVMSSKVIPEASGDLAADMLVVAQVLDRFESSPGAEAVAASKRLGVRCRAVGAPLSATE